VGGIRFREALPLIGKFFEREDGRNRAHRNAGAAINAVVGTDEELFGFLEPRDTTKLGAAVSQIAQALSLAIQESWITKETAARVFANMVSQLGQDVDADEEMKKLAAGLGPSEGDYARKPQVPAARRNPDTRRPE
jgi:hypothetical protein